MAKASATAAVAVAGKKDVFLVALADLKREFFVRKELEESRVNFFMDLYGSGHDVPPIEVVRGTNVLFEGRHRDEAARRLGRTHLECTYVEPKDKPDLILDAFGRNMGGALPPTRADAVFVMRQLIEEGVAQSRVKALFAERFFRPSLAEALVKDARSQVAEAKMKRAVDDVSKGDITVKDAAVKHGVDLEELKTAVSGRKKDKKSKTGVPQIKSDITNRNRANNMKTMAHFRRLLAQHLDGEITASRVEEVYGHVERLNNDSNKRIKQWRDRLKAQRKRVKEK